MPNITTYLPILIPLVIVQLILLIISLRHILTHNTYKIGCRALWLVVVIFINIIGPVAYFLFGRGED